MDSTNLYQAALGVNADYRDAAKSLRDAVRTVGELQEEIAGIERDVGTIEAAAVVEAVGSNEAQRKAAATTVLATSESYQGIMKQLGVMRKALAVQRAEVDYQQAQCRRLHAMLGLLSNAIIAAGPG